MNESVTEVFVEQPGFSEKPNFLGSVSFKSEMFDVTNFGLVLRICIVDAMIFTTTKTLVNLFRISQGETINSKIDPRWQPYVGFWHQWENLTFLFCKSMLYFLVEFASLIQNIQNCKLRPLGNQRSGHLKLWSILQCKTGYPKGGYNEKL